MQLHCGVYGCGCTHRDLVLSTTAKAAEMEFKYVLLPASSGGAQEPLILWESGENRKLAELAPAPCESAVGREVAAGCGADGSSVSGCGDHVRHDLNVAP